MSSAPPSHHGDRTAPCIYAPLFDFTTLLLPSPLARQCLFGTPAIARLQIEGMLLDILDDIFLLNLALEPAKRAFDRFAFLNLDFSQA